MNWRLTVKPAALLTAVKVVVTSPLVLTLLVLGGIASMVAFGGLSPTGHEVVMTLTERIPAPVKIINTPRLNVKEGVVIPGQDGWVEKTVKRRYRGGGMVNEEVMESSLLHQPKRAVRIVGTSHHRRPYMMKREMRVKQTMVMRATAYYPGPEDCAPYDDGYTYLDYKAGYGVCAVDPKVIPLRTKVYVEGYGYALAVDIGSAIKGKKIDVCFDTLKESRAYRTGYVKVHLLE